MEVTGGGGGTGPDGLAGVGVAGRVGSGRDGRGGVLVTGSFPGAEGVGKKSVFVGVRRHVA